MLIDGLREIDRALSAGIRFEEVFLRGSAVDDEAIVMRVEAMQRSDTTANGISFAIVRDSLFTKLAFGHRDEGIVAVAHVPDRSLSSFTEAMANKPDPLIGVLEGVEKPGNVGAVFRSADAAGLDGLLLADAGTDLFNPNTIRASCGTIFSLPFAADTSASIIDRLTAERFQIVVARVEGSDLYTRIDYRRPTAIVLGSEAEGLTSQWSGETFRPIRLPMLGVADSLNVAACAAVLFYEARRQRQERSVETTGR
jgi:TrmH family RNA methyltransferase